MRAEVARLRARSKRHLATTARRLRPDRSSRRTLFGCSGNCDRVLRNGVRVRPESCSGAPERCSGPVGIGVQVTPESAFGCDRNTHTSVRPAPPRRRERSPTDPDYLAKRERAVHAFRQPRETSMTTTTSDAALLPLLRLVQCAEGRVSKLRRQARIESAGRRDTAPSLRAPVRSFPASVVTMTLGHRRPRQCSARFG